MEYRPILPDKLFFFSLNVKSFGFLISYIFLNHHLLQNSLLYPVNTESISEFKESLKLELKDRLEIANIYEFSKHIEGEKMENAADH